MRDVFNKVNGDERTKLRRVMEQRGVQAPSDEDIARGNFDKMREHMPWMPTF